MWALLDSEVLCASQKRDYLFSRPFTFLCWKIITMYRFCSPGSFVATCQKNVALDIQIPGVSEGNGAP